MASRKTGAGARSKAARKKATAGTAKSHAVVPGSNRPPAKGAVRISDADPRSLVEVTITLRGPKLPTADQLSVRAVSAETAVKKYGARQSDADKVRRVLKKLGLKIEEVSLATRSMKVSGTVAAMEAAFHPKLGIYQSEDQGEFRDREDDYKVPGELKGIVTAILGFGERRVARRRLLKTAPRGRHRLKPFGPGDIERHYHFPPGRAAGQKIAIAEFGGGYFAEDTVAYCKKFDRPAPKVSAIGIGTPVRNLQQILRLPRKKRNDELDSSGEVMMDVQVVAGLCPAADISVYFARFSQKGWADLLSRVINDRPVVLSVSWGAAEDSADWSKAAREAVNEQLNLAAAFGITICVASGDDGSGDEETDGRAHVDFPSSSPFVLAVGGTMIVHRGQQFVEEAWWQAPGRRTSHGGGSTGGGVSVVFARPRWQRVRINPINRDGIDGRVVPDVAALAGPPWYHLVFRGKTTADGGTSASAPLWAALIARVNALLPGHKRQRFLVPLLYRRSLSGHPVGRFACHDITVGHNASKPKPGAGFEAAHGFDAVSGWGTPVGTALLFAL